MKRGIFVGLLLVAAGCGGGKSACVPGESTACACSDGTMGAQQCNGDGTYGACSCVVDGSGGNGASSGAGGSGGSNGTGGSGGGGGNTGSTGSKRVFVTSTAYSTTIVPNICNTVAQSAGLSGTWVAWLSDASGGSTIVDAINVVKGTGPWLMLDGSVAFANHAQLATAPSAAIALTEKQTTLPGTDDWVWTGTANGGVHSGADCNFWTSASNDSYSGTVGHATSVMLWTNESTTSAWACGQAAHVYCFEQ